MAEYKLNKEKVTILLSTTVIGTEKLKPYAVCMDFMPVNFSRRSGFSYEFVNETSEG